VTWKVKIGKTIDGKFVLKSFNTEQDAETFMLDWNAKLVNGSSSGLNDLDAVTKHEVLAALERLRKFNATLPEAVEFFIRHARPEQGQITIAAAVSVFLDSKTKVGRRPKYLSTCKKTVLQPFERAFPSEKLVTEVTPTEADNYIHSHPNWGQTTIATHINGLRTFYRFLIRKGYARLNPFERLDKPVAVTHKARILEPTVVKKLLQFALDENRKPECACMALVFFCGIRVEEVERLSWSNVDLTNARVTIDSEAAKIRKRRVNVISENALEWLRLCSAEGKIAPNDYIQRMKRLRGSSGIAYHQNAMRHCFSGYHLAKWGDAGKTAFQLGHPNAQLLYSTYYSAVEPSDVAPYWDIIPDSVRLEREQRARIAKQAADEAQRVEAEELSNCGQAVRLEGNWVPVQKRENVEPGVFDDNESLP
jgi:integrase